MEKTTTEHTEGETTKNNSESIAESFAKTTVRENDNLEMIGLRHVGMYAKSPASLAEFYRTLWACKSLTAVMRVTHSVRLPS
jgi:hypothetical protein